ncbi:MAG: rod shape-determining protein [Peptococcaceae bacterium]|jgi:cell division protein FtsA|nr:rod shape-determining protein [Peptococcaceae bacterium]
MEPLFALDIGTRMVMGLLMTRTDGQYEILASARTEHRQRAMYDGQIHDVDEVARAVAEVKKELEDLTGRQLKSVAVAAAGRALTTQLAGAERHEKLPLKWDRENVLALELEAVQQALRLHLADTEDSELVYHCVGYNVVRYSLEGEKIGNLVGQRGRSARVTVIATFLPRMVLDGLVAVLHQVGLELHSLTLEPIAAGLIGIPENMRRMNLALVDIGAGTADIALTREGNFFAYGMVPVAGDEVTEAICSRYVLDFATGETVKRKLSALKSTAKSIAFKDFFGQKVKIDSGELIGEIRPVVEDMARQIAQEIRRLNGDVPQAVILIGGGSLTPLLPDLLAQTVGIDRSRIGLQIRERLDGVKGEAVLKGPDCVTPIGIGAAALEQKALHYYSVLVNDVSVPIFELQLATAAEALVAVGIQPRAFFGRPGSALTYELNGDMRIVKGQLGIPAQLLINGQAGRLEQIVYPGDELRFTPGVTGADARCLVKELQEQWVHKRIQWNSEEVDFDPLIYINGRAAHDEDPLPDGAKVQYLDNRNLSDLLRRYGYVLNQPKSIAYQVNGQAQVCEAAYEVWLNEEKQTKDTPVRDGDSIVLSETPVRVKDLGLTAAPLEFLVNGDKVLIAPRKTRIFCQGEVLPEEARLCDSMVLRVEGSEEEIIFSQILAAVKIPDTPQAGKKLKMTVNRQPATFTTPVRQGDRIAIGWN